MKLLLIVSLLLSIVGCGRKKEKECRSRESVRLECQATNTPNYGRLYAQEMCNRTYQADRCW